MISIASTIPSALSAPPGPIPGGAEVAAPAREPEVPLAPAARIGAPGEHGANPGPAAERFLRLAVPPEEDRRPGAGAGRIRRPGESARGHAAAIRFSSAFMTQIIAQAIDGPDRPEFLVTHEQGFAAYRAAVERDTQYAIGLLDPFDLDI